MIANLQAWVVVADLTVSIGDNFNSTREQIRRIIQNRWKTVPIVLFGNKLDVLYTRIWEKAKHVYVHLFNRTFQDSGSSLFFELPREITLDISCVLLFYVIGELISPFVTTMKLWRLNLEYRSLLVLR
jgi:hypothetical protein